MTEGKKIARGLKLMLLFLLFAASPAIANSIPPSLNVITLNGAGTFSTFSENNTTLFGGFGQTPGCFSGGSCQDFEFSGIWNGGQLLKGSLWGDFNLDGGATVFFLGNLSKVQYNSSTGELTGVFAGFEKVFTSNGTAFYHVRGTFSEQLNFSTSTTGTFGGGAINITESVLGGVAQVPESGMLCLMATGLCGITAAWRKGKEPKP
jgi:hypothetical protein